MAWHMLQFWGALAFIFSRCTNGKEASVVAKVELSFPADLVGNVHEHVPVYDGEDAAAAAGRLAIEHGIYDGAIILEVARSYKEQLQAVEDFKAPSSLILRTGGAYVRRADEAIKAKKFPEAVADCLRALMRPGLDPTATEPMMDKLGHALLRMERIKEMADQDAQKEEEKYTAQKEEADKLAAEWMLLIAEDEKEWRAIDDADATSKTAAVVKDDAPEVAGVDIDVAREKDGKRIKQSIRAPVRKGEDAHHAAFQFCAANDVHTADEVSNVVEMLEAAMEKKKYKAPKSLKVTTAASHLEKAQSHQGDFELGHAGAHYVRGLHADGVTDEEKEDLSVRLKELMVGYKRSGQFLAAWKEKNYQGVVDALKELPASLRSDLVQLMLARAYSETGKVKESIASITSLLNKCDKSGDWKIGEPRLKAAISGAILALRVGDIEKAKKFYQIVLRNDPEQAYVKKRYGVLRKYIKILTDIEELMNQSKNHDAVKAVERSKELLEKVLGKGAATNAGTRLLLFECKAKSAITFHDDAIEACNTAIEQFENHDNPDPRLIAEAYAWRAEANKRDNSFDDAVADLQVALTKNPNKKEYQEQLEQAKEQQTEWNKSEEQHGRNHESLGNFYSKRPMKQMLDLPDNIDELEKDTKCKWLKSSFRKMSLRWHPDKAKGGKRRAQRKSAELSEGKSLLELQWGCKGAQKTRR